MSEALPKDAVSEHTPEIPREPAAAPIGAGPPVGALRFRLAVLTHYRSIYRLAYAILRSTADAQDVAQETFLRFWQHGQPIERPREWLSAVARNACLDRLRRSAVAACGPLEPGDEPVDARDPAWHADQAELARRLAVALAALPEPQRSLVVLFDQRGLDGAACGRILGLSPTQVKVYLHRARRRLRTMLEQEQ
jgi:RNA polymerase sigma-70 factor (ECF subfamily)